MYPNPIRPEVVASTQPTSAKDCPELSVPARTYLQRSKQPHTHSRRRLLSDGTTTPRPSPPPTLPTTPDPSISMRIYGCHAKTRPPETRWTNLQSEYRHSNNDKNTEYYSNQLGGSAWRQRRKLWPRPGRPASTNRQTHLKAHEIPVIHPRPETHNQLRQSIRSVRSSPVLR